MTSLLLPHLSSSLTDSLASLNLLCHSKTDAQFMQDGQKAVWSIPYIVSVVSFFPSLKQNFIAYHSSKVFSRPDCIFEIHQLWQSGFSTVYSNCYCSCSFEPEIIRIGQSSQKMYSNNIVNFQESMTILNAYTKKSGNLLKAPHIHIYISLSCCAASMDIPDPLSPLVPIVHRLWQVFRATSHILTELLYVCLSFCSTICGGQ